MQDDDEPVDFAEMVTAALGPKEGWKQAAVSKVSTQMMYLLNGGFIERTQADTAKFVFTKMSRGILSDKKNGLKKLMVAVKESKKEQVKSKVRGGRGCVMRSQFIAQLTPPLQRAPAKKKSKRVNKESEDEEDDSEEDESGGEEEDESGGEEEDESGGEEGK